MHELSYTVLIAEDEKLLAKNIARNIERINPKFMVADIVGDGEDAFASLRNRPTDVVFTDIVMPVVDGLELLSGIALEFPFIKSVVLSGHNEFEYARKAIAYNVKDYLLKPVDENELRRVLKKIEMELSSSRERFTRAASGAHTPGDIVAMTKEYIRQNYQNPITLGDIADHFGFTSAYLSRLFDKYEHLPPSKYLRAFRMKIAKQLLSGGQFTIQAVAEMVGYNDPFHFSKSFKQETGRNPTDYRKDDSSE